MKAHHCLVSVMAVAALAACSGQNDAGSGNVKEKAAQTKAAATADPLRFTDVAGARLPAQSPLMQAQVVLDRLGFSPGVIDGKEGQSLAIALKGFQEANDLSETGKLDDATKRALARWSSVPALRAVRVPEGFARGPFFPNFPKDAEQQAKLPTLGYRNLAEALAERFHTTPEVLAALNPRASIAGGATLIVPNIADIDTARLGKDDRGWNGTLQRLGVAPDQPQADSVVVDKSDGVLRAMDAQGKLIAQFPATMGSSHDPLPIGRWKIQGVSRNPDFHYNPKLFWDVSDRRQAVMLKPGPNGPVGVVWLDLSKPHYGIHGTSEPQTIGRAESHGCVRLTNWDAARLAQMVKPGTPAIFQE